MEQNRNKDVKHVYVRERQTDDVFRFWMAATAEEIQAKEREPQEEYVPENTRNSRKLFASSATFALLLVATVFAAGITTTHQTLSYFNDVEASNANSLNAGILDLQINGVDYDGEVTESETGIVIDPALSGVAGNFDMEYKVRAEMISGNEPFCNLIQAHVEGDAPLQYDGPLVSYVGGPSISVGINSFAISLPNATGVANGDVCDIDLVYTAWAKHAADEQGYVDEERVRITLTATGLPEQAPSFLRAFSVFSADEVTSDVTSDESKEDEDNTDESDNDEKEDNRGRDKKEEREERRGRDENSERSESDDTMNAEDAKNDTATSKDKKEEKEDDTESTKQEVVPPTELPPPAEPVTETPTAPEIPQEPPTPTIPAAETPSAPVSSPDPIE